MSHDGALAPLLVFALSAAASFTLARGSLVPPAHAPQATAPVSPASPQIATDGTLTAHHHEPAAPTSSAAAALALRAPALTALERAFAAVPALAHEEGTGEVRGVVRDEEGFPAAGVRVVLERHVNDDAPLDGRREGDFEIPPEALAWRIAARERVAASRRFAGISAADGSFAIGGLPPGRYWLASEARGPWLSLEHAPHVEPGDPPVLVVLREREGVSVPVEIVDDRGRPVFDGDALVRRTDAETEYEGRWERHDAAGSILLKPGVYEVAPGAPDERLHGAAVPLAVSPEGPTPAVLRLALAPFDAVAEASALEDADRRERERRQEIALRESAREAPPEGGATLEVTLSPYAGTVFEGFASAAAGDAGWGTAPDALGRVRLERLSPGPAVVRVVLRAGFVPRTDWAAIEVPVDLAPGENRLAVPLPPVYDLDVIVPSAGHVTLYREGDGAPERVSVEYPASARAVRFYRLPAGRYAARFDAAGEGAATVVRRASIPASAPLRMD